MDAERGKFQYAGLKFLYEMELVEDPQLINHLKLNVLNVLSTSRHIRDVELLSSYHHRAMLIYVDVSWFGKKFRMEQIESEVLELVTQLLPRFKFRVTADRKILELALDKAKAALKGDLNEKPTVTPDPGHAQPSASVAEPKPELQKESDVLQDPETKARD